MVQKWPCVFHGEFIREQVNPRLYDRDVKTPFGAFQREWRRIHCATLNPYGSESCPYEEMDCAIAYLLAAEEALLAKRSRIGLFKSIAKSRALRRADEKPLARDRYDRRTYGHSQGTSGLRGGPAPGPVHLLGREGVVGGDRDAQPVDGQEPVGLRRTGPRSIGSLLRRDGAGSRTQPYRRHEGEASADHDGDARHPVSPPSPGRLGDQPPSGDPEVHQGGE